MSYDPGAISDAYDEYAEREDRFEKGFSLRNDVPREFVKRYLSPDDVVLDAGGGAGINALVMAQRCKRVTLLDLSPGMLERAAANVRQAGLEDKIDLVQGDITCLEQFEAAQFSFRGLESELQPSSLPSIYGTRYAISYVTPSACPSTAAK